MSRFVRCLCAGALLTGLSLAGGAPRTADAAPRPTPKPAAVTAPAATAEMRGGDRLVIGQQLVSADGRYRLIFQTDGNPVLYTDRGVVWASRTYGRGATLFRLQDDSNAVIYNGGTPTWWSGQSLAFVTIGLVNNERARAQCPALPVDWRLQRAAVQHSEDMRNRNYFEHVDPDGRTPADRARAQGYTAGVGENIAAGYPAPETVVPAWMASEGHRNNIQYCGYASTGFGVAQGGGEYGIYWTQMFGLE